MKEPTPPELSDDEVQEFFDRANTLRELEDTLKLYGDWAPIYDATVVRFGPYLSPTIAARTLANHLADRDVPILDVGCGTGLVGAALHAVGFQRIFGLDVSLDMLEEAGSKNVYERLVVADLRAPLPLPAEAFAAAVCVGVFVPGHVGSEAISHVLTAITPNGLFFCDIELGSWQSSGFSDAIGALESSGDITIVNRALGRIYEWPDPSDQGWHLLIQKSGRLP